MEHLLFNYTHCDVFTDEQMQGNSLTVFFLDNNPTQYDNKTLLRITREMKHFESIFLTVLPKINYGLEDITNITVPARIFACSGELDFAGHPLLGAASSIHDKYFSEFTKIKVRFELNHSRIVSVDVNKSKDIYQATMSQGKSEFLGIIDDMKQQIELLSSLNLSLEDYDSKYPMEVVSTGLKYLIVPVKNIAILSKAKIVNDDFKILLEKHNAEFIYLVDLKTKTARTWENDGSSEDAATGSAAGPFGAYLVKYGLEKADEIIKINQGEFMGRVSKLLVKVTNNFEDIMVAGGVCMLGDGCIKLAN